MGESNREILKDLINSIESVKARAAQAMKQGDFVNYSSLMFDLLALENILVTEVSKGLKEEKRA
jgi:hypothetical protein